jgi:hypothetical protein
MSYVRYFQGPINHSRDIIDRIALDQMDAVGEIVRIEGRKVWMRRRKPDDAKSKHPMSGSMDLDREVELGNMRVEEFDVIIMCTGFKEVLPFLNLASDSNDDDVDARATTTSSKGQKKRYSSADAYKLVFDPDDPSLCYIGAARPFLGSIPGLAELQARWAAKVYSGEISLPAPPEMRALVAKDKGERAARFTYDFARLPQLVNHWKYADEIGRILRAKPNQWKWLFKSPRKCVTSHS